MQKKTRKPMVRETIAVEDNWSAPIEKVKSRASTGCIKMLVDELIDEVKGGNSVGLDRILRLKKAMGV